MQKKANLFIVAAPKCGTSSFYRYIMQHKQIFLSSPKEPHYFNTAFSEKYRKPFTQRIFQNDDEYSTLFNNANKEHIVIGEASTWYLRSEVAIPKIYKYNPDSKVIVMLRNPVAMSQSLNAEELFSSNENVKNFEEAWYLQESRLKGKHIPPRCLDLKVILYKSACSLGTQLKRLFSIFPYDQVYPIIFDDFISMIPNVYKNVLNFLNVPFDGRDSFPKMNSRKDHKIKLLNDLFLVTNSPIIFQKISYNIKKIFGLKTLGIKPLLKKGCV